MTGQLANAKNDEIVARRAEALDALDSVLRFDRRDFLAGLLTDDDVATPSHSSRAASLGNRGQAEPDP